MNPLIIKLCEENKSELKASLQKLVLHLFQLGNSEFIESFPSNKIKMIMEIIGKVEK